MPVTTSFPGLYIEELPSAAHTIAAAPTSVAVFIGYSHPYRRNVSDPADWSKPVLVFNFAEYEREFGGHFRCKNTDGSEVIPSALPYAVEQFFLNGGSMAYIVGLPPLLEGNPFPESKPPTPFGPLTFTGLETIDAEHGMSISISNVAQDKKTADLTITFGPRDDSKPPTYACRAETFRNVSLVAGENFVVDRLAESSLVKVEHDTNVAQEFPDPQSANFAISGIQDKKLLDPAQFIGVFQADGPLDKVDIFNLMCIPGQTDGGILAAALAFCERKRAFFIMDPGTAAGPDPTQMVGSVSGVAKSPNGAIYYPYLNSFDRLTGKPTELAPSGFVAGIYARTDTNRGVWKAPAGLETIVNNVSGVVASGRMTDMQAGRLNQAGVNAIRTFPDAGTVVFGARTLVSANVAFQQWKYVPVRRMALFLEQTLLRNLGWVVFEPNDEPLWLAIRSSIETFMLSLFNQQAFQGQTPSEAFLVKCDSTTTTQADIDNGTVNIVVGFRPLKPAEFVIIKIAQLAGQVQS